MGTMRKYQRRFGDPQRTLWLKNCVGCNAFRWGVQHSIRYEETTDVTIVAKGLGYAPKEDGDFEMNSNKIYEQSTESASIIFLQPISAA